MDLPAAPQKSGSTRLIIEAKTHIQRKKMSINYITHSFNFLFGRCLHLALANIFGVRPKYVFFLGSFSFRCERDECVCARRESTGKPQKPLGWTHRGNQQEKKSAKTAKMQRRPVQWFQRRQRENKAKTKLVCSLFSHRVQCARFCCGNPQQSLIICNVPQTNRMTLLHVICCTGFFRLFFGRATRQQRWRQKKRG